MQADSALLRVPELSGRPPAADPFEVFEPGSGRAFAYAVYGAPDGVPVLAFHGTPGSRLKYRIADAEARALGLRLVSIDRWGYGETRAPPSPSLAAFATDMADFAEALGEPKFGIIGISGGGPFALAAAAGLGARSAALALVAPVAPLRGPLACPDAMARMSGFHRLAFFGTPMVPGLPRAVFQVLRLALRADAGFAMRAVTARACPSDRAIACAPGMAERLAEAFREGLRPGVDGPAIDMRIFARPWDIELGAITGRSALWIGELDRNVPIDAAKALRTHLAGLEIVVPPRAGHFWISRNHGDVLEWLVSALTSTGKDQGVA